MDVMREAALDGVIIFWILDNDNYDKLRDNIDGCEKIIDFNYDLDEIPNIKKFAKSMGVTEENLFENSND